MLIYYYDRTLIGSIGFVGKLKQKTMNKLTQRCRKSKTIVACLYSLDYKPSSKLNHTVAGALWRFTTARTLSNIKHHSLGPRLLCPEITPKSLLKTHSFLYATVSDAFLIVLMLPLVKSVEI